LEAAGHRRTVVASAASFLVVAEMVASSDLVALVPRRLLQSRPGHLDVVEVPWLSERFQVGMIWHERVQGHRGQQWVREAICELTAG
jgi:DNA-binding transcriptional LysR family regulator